MVAGACLLVGAQCRCGSGGQLQRGAAPSCSCPSPLLPRPRRSRRTTRSGARPRCPSTSRSGPPRRARRSGEERRPAPARVSLPGIRLQGSCRPCPFFCMPSLLNSWDAGGTVKILHSTPPRLNLGPQHPQQRPRPRGNTGLAEPLDSTFAVQEACALVSPESSFVGSEGVCAKDRPSAEPM